MTWIELREQADRLRHDGTVAGNSGLLNMLSLLNAIIDKLDPEPAKKKEAPEAQDPYEAIPGPPPVEDPVAAAERLGLPEIAS